MGWRADIGEADFSLLGFGDSPLVSLLYIIPLLVCMRSYSPLTTYLPHATSRVSRRGAPGLNQQYMVVSPPTDAAPASPLPPPMHATPQAEKAKQAVKKMHSARTSGAGSGREEERGGGSSDWDDEDAAVHRRHVSHHHVRMCTCVCVCFLRVCVCYLRVRMCVGMCINVCVWCA